MVEPTPAAPTPAAEACMCRFVDLVDIEISGFIFLFIVNTLTILTDLMGLMFMPS